MPLPSTLTTELQEAFLLFDYDKDNKITSKELGPVLRSVGLNPTQAELDEIIKEMGGGGLLDVKAVCKLLDKNDRYNKLSTSRQDLRDALSVFDRAGDGTISVQDLRLSLTTLGERLSDEELDQVIRAVDQDGDGQIRIDEVCSVLLSA